MTLANCDELVDFFCNNSAFSVGLTGNRGSSNVINDNNGASSIVYCKHGFDERYEKPESKGGRYVTLSDLRNMFTIGVEHGRNKILGWKNRYNSAFAAAIGGYPRGSIVRTNDGIRMISRIPNNNSALPEDGESNNYWKKVIPTKWLSEVNTKVGYSLYTSIRLKKTIPSWSNMGSMHTKFNEIVAEFTPDWSTGLVIFTYACYCENTKKQYLYGNLDCAGSMSMKISKYSDILTNPDHADDYIEVLHSDSYTIEDIPGIGFPVKCRRRKPHQAIPLKPGVKYYIYLEYGADKPSGLGPSFDNNELVLAKALVAYSSARELKWPKV